MFLIYSVYVHYIKKSYQKLKILNYHLFIVKYIENIYF